MTRPARVVPRSAPLDCDKQQQVARSHTNLLGEVLDVLTERVRQVVVHALDAQSRPALLMTEERVAAELLDVSTRTVRDRLLPDGLPHVLVGDQRRYDPAEVLEWLRARAPRGGTVYGGVLAPNAKLRS